ncbi:MAG TPA: hypothetical protein VFI91_09745 [Longimicrobiaceae bacterium]|nr:hypothetical protein [Longimicrobiaceae bacterium]
MKIRILPILAAMLALAACGDDDDGGIVGPGSDGPQDLNVRYEWIVEAWPDGEAVGHPAVQVTWNLSDDWAGEPFRVYGRESSESSYLLLATVTSCSAEAGGLFDCQYTDLNVVHDESYDYYVAAVDERTGSEIESEDAVQVEIPEFTPPNVPGEVEVTTLDGALFLQWPLAGENDPLVWKYLVFLTGLDGEEVLYQVGETDGGVFLDERAENGFRYEYRVAAVDTFGQTSDMSPAGSGIPRPDYHAELLYSAQDSSAASGFAFTSSGTDSPVRPGNSADAQFRVEETSAGVQLVPLGATAVTGGTFTTALACSAGSEPDCLSVEVASTDAGDYSGTPVELLAGYTYVLRVEADGGTHYGKIRVQGSGLDGSGQTYLVFDWAYQLVPGEPELIIR